MLYTHLKLLPSLIKSLAMVFRMPINTPPIDTKCTWGSHYGGRGAGSMGQYGAEWGQYGGSMGAVWGQYGGSLLREGQ